MLIETKNLTKTYGEKTVVNQLNLEIPKGSLVAYLGTNGAGKSTTIKMLTGLLAPTSGKVILASDLKIGIVFQDSVLDEELTVRANLKNRAGLYQHIDKTWLNELVELTGLSGFLGQKYGTLSGGQRRRVDITRALLNKPDLLFLDEPTTGLDIQTRQMIWQLLYRLKKEQGLTIFLTTHYLEEAENAEVTYVIDHGKILAQGTAFDIVKEYAKSQLLLKVADPTSLAALPFPLKETEAGYLIEGVSSQEVIGLLGKYREAIADFEFKQGTINEAFIAITGKEIS
ncbi:ABC transporter ATP-binding protein [Streptococcus orisratti]|uniref:ABC transporter ATP-binding protein n=1 Tax=Streptococcus orisratti TaxID=114652 RepID=UPI0003701E24|nr:ABC transporter ATP-binding protein [Streptococcus orisratti]